MDLKFSNVSRPDLYEYSMDVRKRGLLPKCGKSPLRFRQSPYSAIAENAEITDSAL